MANDTQAPASPFRKGITDMLPLTLGGMPFGLITGMAAAEAGVGPWLGIGYSLIMYAGASQLAMLQLMLDDALPVIAILTVWVINLRFVIYSAGLSFHWRAVGGATKAIAAFLITDQSYALAVAEYARRPDLTLRQKMIYYFAGAVLMGTLWVGMTAVGYFLAAGVPKSWHMEFAMPIMFLAILMPNLKDRPSLLAAAVSGAITLALYDLPLNLSLFIGANLGILSGYLADRRKRNRAEQGGAS